MVPFSCVSGFDWSFVPDEALIAMDRLEKMGQKKWDRVRCLFLEDNNLTEVPPLVMKMTNLGKHCPASRIFW